MGYDDMTIEDCLILYKHYFTVIFRAGVISCIKYEKK